MRHHWRALATTALLASAVLAADAAYARPITNPSPDGVVMGVTGWTDNGYVRQPGATAWTNWGGQLKGAPAVIRVGGVTHTIGTDLNTGRLIHRTNLTGWGSLTTSGPCPKPSVAGVPDYQSGAGVFWMSCVGNNGHAYIRKLTLAQEVVKLTDVGAPPGDSDGPNGFQSLSIAVRSLSEGNQDGVVLTGTGSFEGENVWRKNVGAGETSWTDQHKWCSSDVASAIHDSTGTGTELNLCDGGAQMYGWEVGKDGVERGSFLMPGTGDNKIGMAALEGGGFIAGVEGMTDGIPRYRKLDLAGPTTSSWGPAGR